MHTGTFMNRPNHPQREVKRRSDFQHALRNLLNTHSMENASDTPDFILAVYLQGCLDVYNAATRAREDWYGRKKDSSELTELPAK
jgi:hypothetical protein